MSEEEAAFYDALAGGAQDIEADPKLAAIASELVQTLTARNPRFLTPRKRGASALPVGEVTA